MPFRILASAQKDTGRVYDINEDSVLAINSAPDASTPYGLFVIADGIGGHQAGDLASQMVVDTISEMMTPELVDTSQNGQNELDVLEGLSGQLARAIEKTNESIYNYAQKNKSDAGNLGSTISAVLIYSDHAYIFNVGDSRSYLLRDKTLKQLTRDHSYVAELVDRGIIVESDIYSHPHRSIITRALGTDKSVEFDRFFIDLLPGDRLLLCSDGLWEMVADHIKLEHFAQQYKDVEQTSKYLIKKANEAGGKDNISVISVYLEPT
jgi:serine/threonine protein phosphatase PrpC